jgi:hypothetical protein
MIKLGDLCAYSVVLFASEAVVQGLLSSTTSRILGTEVTRRTNNSDHRKTSVKMDMLFDLEWSS